MRVLAIAIIIAVAIGAGAYIYTNQQDAKAHQHCRYVSYPDTPYQGVTSSQWVCKSY